MDAIVEVRDLVKRFGDVTAVDGVSFGIAEGEVFGLLGPNGAGKTTTISAISCLLAPDSGEVTVAGMSATGDSLGVRRNLGVVPQEIALYPTLTASENLRFWGRMYGLSGRALSEAVEYGLAMAGLEDKAKKRVETFSGGMKRRINIAAGVLHRPKVLLMDEPTVGIDPQSRNHILQTVRDLNEGGVTVLYTSHYMEEVEALCDRIAIVDHGRVIASGTLDELRALVGDEDVVRITLAVAGFAETGATDGDASQAQTSDSEPSRAGESGIGAPAQAQMDAALDSLRAIGGISSVDAKGAVIEALAPNAASVLGPMVEALSLAGIGVRAIEVVEPDLESVFLHLTGRGLRD